MSWVCMNQTYQHLIGKMILLSNLRQSSELSHKCQATQVTQLNKSTGPTTECQNAFANFGKI